MLSYPLRSSLTIYRSDLFVHSLSLLERVRNISKIKLEEIYELNKKDENNIILGGVDKKIVEKTEIVPVNRHYYVSPPHILSSNSSDIIIEKSLINILIETGTSFCFVYCVCFCSYILLLLLSLKPYHIYFIKD
jgi:hypothetical protein